MRKPREFWIQGGRSDRRPDWVSETPEPGLIHVVEVIAPEIATTPVDEAVTESNYIEGASSGNVKSWNNSEFTCCDNESRTMEGGCANCGAPSY